MTAQAENEQHLRAVLQGLEYDEIADEVERSAGGGRVLDWGAGRGQMTHRLAHRGLRVDAFDFDPEAKGAEERPFGLYPELRAIRSDDPVGLPYGDGTFDVVLSCGVLEHVEHPLASLMEIRRILKPGGVILVYKLPNQLSYLEAVARAAGMPYHGMRTHDTLWGIRSTRWALDAAGFDIDWVRRAHLVPLAVDRPIFDRRAAAWWRLNKKLSRTPGLNLFATNIEGRATKPASVAPATSVKREITS